jgi:hypothetical protein
MGEETTRFKGCLIHRMKRGGGGNGRQMRCRAHGNGSMAGEAGAVLGGGRSWRQGCYPALVQKEEEEVGWAKRPNRPVGQLGQNLKRIAFQNKIWIIEYTKALEICTRRFRRNFDVGMFPKFL